MYNDQYISMKSIGKQIIVFIDQLQNADRLRKSMRIRKRSWYREKQEKRLNRMIILMILAFNISWTPYAFVCTLKLVHHNFVSDAWAVPGLLLAKRYDLSLTGEMGDSMLMFL